MLEMQLTGRLSQLNRILFLEDDPLFAESLVDLLQESKYSVTHVSTGQDAIEITFDKKFDLYLLDINVPLLNGLSVLKELRDSKDKTPTIFLTSHKDKEILKQSFLNGGDDFVNKPFDNDELLLRINALLARSNSAIDECIGLLCHDEVHQQILYDKKELELSKKEYQLLLLLMKHINNPVPKDMILDELWSKAEGGSEGALRVYINRIKQLLPQMSIENVRGFGYKLVS
jgi:DNA-binding response OmpR family regulator